MNFEYEFDAGVRAYLTGYFRKDPKALAAMSGLGPYSGHWQWPREAGEELDRRRTAILASLPESELLAIECGQIKMEAAIKRLVDELKDPHRIEDDGTNPEREDDAGLRAFLKGYFRKDPAALVAMNGLGPHSWKWKWPREASCEISRRRTAILASLSTRELLDIECGRINVDAVIESVLDEGDAKP